MEEYGMRETRGAKSALVKSDTSDFSRLQYEPHK